MRAISLRGRIVLKRAYGNWRKEHLKNWEEVLKGLGIKAMQQFDYVQGKNATDIALTIDAVYLLHQNLYDTFVLVSSDSDYTPLAIHLSESGANVIGAGERKTPDPFINSCHDFIFLEDLGRETQETKALEDGIDFIHTLLKEGWDQYQDEDGYVGLGGVGSYIKRVKPAFNVKTYGYPRLSSLIKNFPKKYEIREDAKGPVSYRCLNAG